MAMTYLCGFEMNTLAEAQDAHGGTGLSIVTGRNSGLGGRATSSNAFELFVRAAGGTNTALFQSVRLYLKVVTLPVGGAAALIRVSGSGSPLRYVVMETNGALSLCDSTAATVATSAASVLSADGNFHRIDYDCGYNAGSGWRVSVDGTVVVSSSASTATIGDKLNVGPGTTFAGFTSIDVTIDDIVAYDSALPATLNDYSLGLLKPVSDNAVGNWKRNDGITASNEFSAVDNTPPTGTAVTAVLAANYIQNSTAGSGSANDRVDLGTQAYTNLTGLTDASQVKAIMAIANGAQQVTTGSPKSGSLTTYTNAANVGVRTFDYGLPNGLSGSTSAAAQGVFPAGWGTVVGAVLENPSVTVGSGAGVRVNRSGTYTRVISLDFVGVYVMWEALAAAASIVFPSHRLNPAMLRR